MRIRQKIYPSGVIRWCADLGKVAGKRIERFFKTKEQAEGFLRQAHERIKAEGESVALTTAATVRRYQIAEARIAPTGKTIEQVVEFFMSHHSARQAAPPLPEMQAEYIAELERLKRSPRYIGLSQSTLARFLDTVPDKALCEITRNDVSAWVLSPEIAAATQANRLVAVRAFFQWAKRRRYIPSAPIEGIDAVRVPQPDRGEIEAYGVEDCRKILYAVLFAEYAAFSAEDGFFQESFRDLAGYVALALFAGVRPAELQRSTTARLNLRDGTFLVTGAASKTNKTRVVELPRVAVVWLRLWRLWHPTETRITPTNFDRKWRALKKAANLSKWVHDGLRHTFASMHYATHQNAPLLKSLMGHSEREDTLHQHYRAVLTVTGEAISKRSAARFWELTPKRVNAV